mmetsp:Transcript_4594/g.7764  ORF Transcript_4594/g.7764 Transcript_4594/m.7764 type:complete len:150 (-) Transcript_4594:9-458(-)
MPDADASVDGHEGEIQQPDWVDKRRWRRITWDEHGIAMHDAERGVMFGKMKVNHPDTPFLYLNEDDPCGDMVGIHHKNLPTHMPTAEQGGGPGPSKMFVKELQEVLGLVVTDNSGCASFSEPKWAQGVEFEAKRQIFYCNEARVAALSW